MAEGNISRAALVLDAWAAIVRSGSTEAVAPLLREHVVWQGVLPEQVCRGRREVLSLLARRQSDPPPLTGLEANEVGECVVVSFEIAGAPDRLGEAGPRWIVLTFEGGKVVRMQSFADRDAAYRLARPAP